MGRTPATERPVTRPRSDRHIREGDIVVTAVAKHYVIGRMTADGNTQDWLGSRPIRAEALVEACALAGTAHRVFLYGNAGTNAYRLFDGAAPSQ